MGADTKDIEKYGLLDCFSWLIHTVFYSMLDHQPWEKYDLIMEWVFLHKSVFSKCPTLFPVGKSYECTIEDPSTLMTLVCVKLTQN